MLCYGITVFKADNVPLKVTEEMDAQGSLDITTGANLEFIGLEGALRGVRYVAVTAFLASNSRGLGNHNPPPASSRHTCRSWAVKQEEPFPSVSLV